MADKELELARARAKAKLKLRASQVQEQPVVDNHLSQMKYEPDVGKGEALFRGAESVVGLGDEAAGLSAGLYEALNPEPDTQKSAMERFKAGFTGGRQDELRQIEQAYDAQPNAFALGALGGAATQSVPLGKAATGVQSLAGAVQGAAQGDTLLERAALAILGAGLPYGVRGVVNPEAALNKRAITSMTDLPSGVRNKIASEYGEEGLQQLGKQLRERGVVNQPFTSASEAQDLFKSAASDLGSELASRIEQSGISVPKEVIKRDLMQIVGQSKDPRYARIAANSIDELISQYGDELTGPQIQELQKTLASRAGSYGNTALQGSSEILDDSARYLRESLGVDPAVKELQSSYAALKPAESGFASPIGKDYAKMKASTAKPKLFGSTLGAPEVQSTINAVLEKALVLQEGKYAPIFQQAAMRGGDSAVRALHFSLLQQDPIYNQEMREAK